MHPNAHAGQNRRKGIAEAAERFVRKIKAEEYKYGRGRGIISAEFQGARVVAVDDRLFSSDKWKTFADFLFDYPRFVFGRAWGKAELEKPEAERHIVMQWYGHVCEAQRKQTPGPDGVYAMKADGITFSYFALAYDLYVLRHNQKLQDRVIHRLKHNDQFQGARYELTVAATLVRAGCEMDFEDESDGTSTHPELLATHRTTKESFDVEAKSRHRSGVLGRSGEQQEMSQLKLGIRDKLNQAKRKVRDRPFVVFVDANVPPERFSPTEPSWRDEIRHEVEQAVADDGGTSPFSLVVVTNFADHYRACGETAPGRLSLVLEPSGAVSHPLHNPTLIRGIEQALRQYGNIPNFFPDESRQMP